MREFDLDIKEVYEFVGTVFIIRLSNVKSNLILKLKINELVIFWLSFIILLIFIKY